MSDPYVNHMDCSFFHLLLNRATAMLQTEFFEGL